MTRNNVTIKSGVKADFVQLATLDYSNTEDRMFSLAHGGNTLTLTESELPTPRHNESQGYQEEIINDVIPSLERQEAIPLVALVDGSLAGYLLAFWHKRSRGMVINLDGILVANTCTGKGVGSALLNELIGISKTDTRCRGIHAEMGTDKYAASKLLLKSRFTFSGAELYIYSNSEPTQFSKEAIYFYRKTKE